MTEAQIIIIIIFSKENLSFQLLPMNVVRKAANRKRGLRELMKLVKLVTSSVMLLRLSQGMDKKNCDDESRN